MIGGRPALPVLLLLAGALLTPAASAQTDSPALRFAEPDELTLALPSDDLQSVWLVSDRAEGAALEWELLVDKGGGKVVRVQEDAQAGEPLLVVQGPDGIAANTVERYRVRVRSLSPDNVKGGQLVATAGDAAPASLDVSISKRSDPEPTMTGLLLWPIVIALVVVFFRTVTVKGGFGGVVGTLDLDFSKGFATTLTAVGALLGTILSAGLLDETPAGLSKEEFAALNLTFGALILVAPTLYMVSLRQEKTQVTKDGKTVEETHYEGRTWGLSLATVVTLWAVLGQIATLFFLLGELDAGGAISSTAMMLIQGAVVFGGLLSLVYAWRKFRWIVNTAAGAAAPDLAGGFFPAEAAGRPALPSFTPF